MFAALWSKSLHSPLIRSSLDFAHALTDYILVVSITKARAFDPTATVKTMKNEPMLSLRAPRLARRPCLARGP
eukprot:7606464-Pyramimonas_sp.AAC.1